MAQRSTISRGKFVNFSLSCSFVWMVFAVFPSAYWCISTVFARQKSFTKCVRKCVRDKNSQKASYGYPLVLEQNSCNLERKTGLNRTCGDQLDVSPSQASAEKQAGWFADTVNPEYFVRTQFSYPGLSDLSYAWNFRTVADCCRFSGMLCTFRMHFIFVRKAARTEYTKITCIRNILDLQ